MIESAVSAASVDRLNWTVPAAANTKEPNASASDATYLKEGINKIPWNGSKRPRSTLFFIVAMSFP